MFQLLLVLENSVLKYMYCVFHGVLRHLFKSFFIPLVSIVFISSRSSRRRKTVRVEIVPRGTCP